MLLTRLFVRSAVAKTSLNQPWRCLSTNPGTTPESAQANAGEASSPQQQNLENELKSLKESLTQRDAEIKDFKDKYMRALAETENIRTRMIKQVDDAKIFGIQGFCKDLLEVADVLSLAIENTNPNKKSSDDAPNNSQSNALEQLNAMFNGLVMTEKSLLKIFEKHGLVQIKPCKGDPFDPNMHDAIFRVPESEMKSGSVFTSTKTGFMLRGRVIRAAQVGVVQ